MYFAGILTTILIVPYLIDNYGRKYITIISNFVLIGCTIGILIATDITSLYILLFFAGTSFGGRLIGGLNWLIEWCPWRQQVLFVKMLSGSFSVILITAWFQFGTRHYKEVAIPLIILAIIGTLYTLIIVPESPQW